MTLEDWRFLHNVNVEWRKGVSAFVRRSSVPYGAAMKELCSLSNYSVAYHGTEFIVLVPRGATPQVHNPEDYQ